MSRGNPDFFGVPITPSYGVIMSDNASRTITTNPETYEMISLSRKCVITSLFLDLYFNDTTSEIVVAFNVDDSVSSLFDIVYPIEKNMFTNESSPLKIISYNPIDKHIILVLDKEQYCNSAMSMYGLFKVCVGLTQTWEIKYRDII
jgi:hypothetical protein